MDENGSWRSDEQQIGGIVERCFQGIFSTSHPTNMDEVLASVDNVVTQRYDHPGNQTGKNLGRI